MCRLETIDKSNDIVFGGPAVKDYIWWVHIPKTGTSFGTVLVHHANQSLPHDARMPNCDDHLLNHNTSTTRIDTDSRYRLAHPYEPHVCSGATDVFFAIYPRARWFPGWFAVDGPRSDRSRTVPGAHVPGTHVPISGRQWAQHYSHFQGLFRDPSSLKVSQYLRAFHGPGPIDIHDPLINFSTAIGRTALLNYARRTEGSTVRFVLGQPINTSHCDAFVSKAVSRLRGFSYFGVTTEWEASVCLYHRMVMHGRACVSAEFENDRPTQFSNPHLGVRVLAAAGWHDRCDEPFFSVVLEQFNANLIRYSVDSSSCAAIRCTASQI